MAYCCLCGTGGHEDYECSSNNSFNIPITKNKAIKKKKMTKEKKKKMTKAKKYKKMWSSLFGAPQIQLDNRWTAAVNKYGGLTFRCNGVSRGSLSEESTLKLIEFLEDTFVKEVK